VCGTDDTLASAAAAMWEEDCGMLPVVDSDRHAIGVITDRDICIATAFGNRAPSQMRVGEVIYRRPFTCHPEENVKSALRVMRDHRVRRLPVTDHNGRVVGVISINDIILQAANARHGKTTVGFDETITTLKVVCEHAREQHAQQRPSIPTGDARALPRRSPRETLVAAGDFDFEE